MIELNLLPDFESRTDEVKETTNAGATTFSDTEAIEENKEPTSSFSNPLFDQEPPAVQEVCEAKKEMENPLFGLVNEDQEQISHASHETEKGA